MSPLQLQTRRIMSALSIQWNELTPLRRDAWNVYAANVTAKNRLGQTIHLTGFAHFIRSNSPRMQAGDAQVLDAPTIFNLGEQVNTLTVIPEGVPPVNELLISWNSPQDWEPEVGAFLYVWQGRPVNPSINFYGGPWRYAGALPGEVGPPGPPVVFPNSYAFQETQRVFIKARVSRADGRLSDFAHATGIAV